MLRLRSACLAVQIAFCMLLAADAVAAVWSVVAAGGLARAAGGVWALSRSEIGRFGLNWFRAEVVMRCDTAALHSHGGVTPKLCTHACAMYRTTGWALHRVVRAHARSTRLRRSARRFSRCYVALIAKDGFGLSFAFSLGVKLRSAVRFYRLRLYCPQRSFGGWV